MGKKWVFGSFYEKGKLTKKPKAYKPTRKK
jgi:hypothetical protein